MDLGGDFKLGAAQGEGVAGAQVVGVPRLLVIGAFIAAWAITLTHVDEAVVHVEVTPGGTPHHAAAVPWDIGNLALIGATKSSVLRIGVVSSLLVGVTQVDV